MVGTQAGIELIQGQVSKIKADAMIAVAEHVLVWLAGNRDSFMPGCSLLCPTASCLDALASKAKQIEIARASGFSILPTWYLTRPADVAGIGPENFPVCIRPSHPSTVRPLFKAAVCHDEGELERRLSELEWIGEPIIAQCFRMLPDLKVHGIRSRDGSRTRFEAFYVERKFQGVTLTLTRAEFPPGLEESCRQFAERADIAGGFHFDFLFDPLANRAYYLEVNVRMGGVTDKAKAFGFDQPRLILEAFDHPTSALPIRPGTRRKRVVTKRAVCRHLLSALQGELTELDYPAHSRVQHALLSIRDLLTARDSVFDWRDLRGTIWFYTQPVAL